ncbi:uncharacterized protein LOC118150577 isoform X1 [Callithrix jacchus]
MKPRVTSSRTYARTSRQETLFSLRVLTPASAPGQQGSWRPAAWTNDRKEEKEPEGGKRRGAGQGHQAGVLSSELRHQQGCGGPTGSRGVPYAALRCRIREVKRQDTEEPVKSIWTRGAMPPVSGDQRRPPKAQEHLYLLGLFWTQYSPKPSKLPGTSCPRGAVLQLPSGHGSGRRLANSSSFHGTLRVLALQVPQQTGTVGRLPGSQ